MARVDLNAEEIRTVIRGLELSCSIMSTFEKLPHNAETIGAYRRQIRSCRQLADKLMRELAGHHYVKGGGEDDET